MSDGDDTSKLVDKKREFIDSFFRKGAEFTRELLQEIDRLRRREAELEDELMRRGHPQPSGTTLRELAEQISALEAERDQLRSRLVHIDSDDHRFSERYSEIERENNDLASLYVAQGQMHSTLVASEVIQVMTEILLNFVGASQFAILLLDSESSPQVLAVEAMDRANVNKLVAGTDVIGTVLGTNRPHFSELPEGRESDQDPIVCFPLRQGATVVGAICVWGFWIQKEELSDLDHRMFHLLGSSGGHALEAARLAALDDVGDAANNGSGPYERYSALLQ